jgi:VWA domain-containing protein
MSPDNRPPRRWPAMTRRRLRANKNAGRSPLIDWRPLNLKSSVRQEVRAAQGDRRQKVSRITQLGLAAVALALGFLGPASRAGEAQSAELTVLKEKLGKTKEQADFSVVLDRSGTMQKFWEPVKEAVTDFLGAVPDGDYLSVLYFDANADHLVTPRQVTSASRGPLREQIRQLPKPTGGKTDLGRSWIER